MAVAAVRHIAQQASVHDHEAREEEEDNEEQGEQERAVAATVADAVHEQDMQQVHQQQEEEAPLVDAPDGDDVEDLDDDEEEVKVDVDDEEEVKVDVDEEEEVKVDLDDEEETGAVNPNVGDRVEVEWLLGADRGLYTGVVDKTDWKINSQNRDAAFEYRYHVLYDDGDKRWETMGSSSVRLTILERAAKAAAGSAEGLEVLSRTRRRS